MPVFIRGLVLQSRSCQALNMRIVGSLIQRWSTYHLARGESCLHILSHGLAVSEGLWVCWLQVWWFIGRTPKLEILSWLWHGRESCFPSPFSSSFLFGLHPKYWRKTKGERTQPCESSRVDQLHKSRNAQQLLHWTHSLKDRQFISQVQIYA